MRVVGLMSGTSYDAVDAAAADLTLDEDGTLRLVPLGMVSAPYEDTLRAALAAALPPAPTTLGDVCRLDTRIGQAFAALAVRADRELCAGRAELMASHGQTVFHWADAGRVHGTLQIGSPAWIAEATGRPVVSDFRPRDVAAGGQGAPLVSLVDLMLLRGRPGVPAALNIGGIANLTVLPATGPPLAFDTGPGNALLDAAVRELTAGRLDHDADGALAAAGRVHPPLLRRLLDEPYYRLPAPKTTGKELFHPGHLRAALAPHPGLAPQDVLATLTRLTARTVADALRPLRATEVIASGGGTRNPALMAALREELPPGTALLTSDALGLPAAAKEAYAFAVLGFLTVHGLPGNAPDCTGARGPRVLGSLTPGRRPLTLPPAPTRPPGVLVIGDRSAGDGRCVSAAAASAASYRPAAGG
ncbi:Anhydro-N-acetylmuramic acid kinase [Streptomyces lavendulae subsp. lavendulae]|uniref:Anhydro-N-acetylmuramic acid kinase n=1 Tax=Streptomyces lavendulae subsp. lavendulae TaxID=58340 RepID=A0A2K8P7C0_STRLA|nr:anhydro-N-acetylmuramic acid kinase [Streptomyces lavendulae]ATZ22644.1 Anhydro-N-acetylmuramic acid kinase [Streptomyces lavendulae subsp. lavendulae]QUQ52486.1 Anhydro-N-acetylmuramic acid kinase [Streptomyces lavendulae subsp. lavendulae]